MPRKGAGVGLAVGEAGVPDSVLREAAVLNARALGESKGVRVLWEGRLYVKPSRGRSLS